MPKYVGAVHAAYMSSPCHIELVLSEQEAPVKKEVMMQTPGFSCYVYSFSLSDPVLVSRLMTQVRKSSKGDKAAFGVAQVLSSRGLLRTSCFCPL